MIERDNLLGDGVNLAAETPSGHSLRWRIGA